MTNYSNVVEAGSESDDEDKLHIVEEESSLADGADCDSTLPDDELPRDHCWDRGETHRLHYYYRTSALNHANTHHHLHSHHFSNVLKHVPRFCIVEKFSMTIGDNSTKYCTRNKKPWIMSEWAHIRKLHTILHRIHCKRVLMTILTHDRSKWPKQKEYKYLRMKKTRRRYRWKTFNLEKQQDSKAFSDPARRQCRCAVNKNKKALQLNSYLTSCLLRAAPPKLHL